MTHELDWIKHICALFIEKIRTVWWFSLEEDLPMWWSRTWPDKAVREAVFSVCKHISFNIWKLCI